MWKLEKKDLLFHKNKLIMSQLRRKVLNQFKSLHRARKFIFDGDQNALEAARKQINENFRKNQDVTDPAEIEKLVKFAKDVERELRTNVIQTVEKKPGVYQAKITRDTTLLDNKLYREDAIISPPTGNMKCCKEK